MSEIITNSIGDRLTYCRSSLCLTRNELVQAWGAVSIPTLSRWELDTVKIPRKKLSSLIIFFNTQGLLVSESWILEGTGSPPLLFKNNAFDELDFDTLAQEKLLDINRQAKNFIFGQVRNNLISPLIKYGDYIGGSSSETASLIGELVFIKKKNFGIMAGILKDCSEQVVIKNFNDSIESVSIAFVENIGKIQWIVRRP